MACLDSLYADSRSFAVQIAKDPGKLDVLAGREIALLDLELTQAGSPVWDYVAFAARNGWSTPEIRSDVENWCRERLTSFYGAAAAADFDRYLVLEAWKSAAGDSFRLPLRIASDPAFIDGESAVLDEAAQGVHRNLTRVFAAAGREAPELAEIREHLARWARQLVHPRAREPEEVETVVGDRRSSEPGDDAGVAGNPRLPRWSIRGLLAAGAGRTGQAENLDAALAGSRCADGPARLELVSARFERPDETDTEIVSRIRMRTVLMDGPREYGDVTVVFESDHSRRITARLESPADLDGLAGQYGGPYLLGPVEDLARRLGADVLSVEVFGAEGVRAAKHGFDWDTSPARLAATTESFQGAVQALGPRGVAEARPVPLPGTPQEVARSTGPGVLRSTRWWARKSLVGSPAPVTPIEYYAPTRRPNRRQFLLDAAAAVGDSGMAPEKVAQLAVTTAMEPAHARGHYTHVWCVTDSDENTWKVRYIAAEVGTKDFAANPTHPNLVRGDRFFHRIELPENRAEELARASGVDVPATVAEWGAHPASRGASSIRQMGPGAIPSVTDPNRWVVLRQLRRLQAAELPGDLAVRSLTEHEQLYRSTERIKYEQRHEFLDALHIPMPHEIWLPGESGWAASGELPRAVTHGSVKPATSLSHGNVTFRNLWVRPDREVALDNWNLTGVRHRLWDYVTIFWSPWTSRDLERVTILVENEIHEQYGAAGVGEFRRLRAMACLDSLYSDSATFVQKIRMDARQADALTGRLYSDYLTLWRYAEAAGLWPARGARPLEYGLVRQLVLHAADPTLPAPAGIDPGHGIDAVGAAAIPDHPARADLTRVPVIPELLAENLGEDRLRARLSGLEQQYGPGIELMLDRVEYLRTESGGFVSGVRIRGVFVSARSHVEVGNLDLGVEWDEDDRLVAQFDDLWIEPWHERSGCARWVVPELRDYLRRSGVEEFRVTVRGRRGAAAAIRHDIDWDHRADPHRLAESMQALSMRIRAQLSIVPAVPITPSLAQLLESLEVPGGRYPTPAEIARLLPPGIDVVDFFDGLHWVGVAAP